MSEKKLIAVFEEDGFVLDFEGSGEILPSNVSCLRFFCKTNAAHCFSSASPKGKN